MTHDKRLEKFTVIRPVVMEDSPNARMVFLKAGNQQFCVTPHGCENQEEAEIMRGMLCIALAKIIAEGP